MRKLTLLGALVIAVVLKQLAWVSFIPIWQTPDEQAHFAQVSVLGETNSLYIPEKNLSREIYESEKRLGVLRDAYGNNKYTYHPEYNIKYSDSLAGIEENYLKTLPKSSRQEYLINEAAWYPPAYYIASSAFYKAFDIGSIFDRVFGVRLLNVLLMALLFLVTVKIGKLIFDKEAKALFLGVLVAFAPMVTFVYTGVTSDTLFILLFSLFIWRCLVFLKEGITVKNLLIVLAILLVSFYTKPQANIMAFILAPLLAYILLSKGNNKKIAILVVGVILLSLFGILFRILNGAPLIPESSGSLEITPQNVIEHTRFTLTHTYREVLPWFWGVFRWLSLGLPDILRKVTSWLTILSFVGFGVYIFKKVKSKKTGDKFLMKLFLLFSIIVYFAALTIFDFAFRQGHGFSFGIQGRYFFPVIVPIMAVILIGLTEVFPENYQVKIGSVLSVLMIIFNVIIFFWITGSYYVLTLPTFLIQASQYKPEWFKYPINIFVLIAFIISSLATSVQLVRISYVTKSD